LGTFVAVNLSPEMIKIETCQKRKGGLAETRHPFALYFDPVVVGEGAVHKRIISRSVIRNIPNKGRRQVPFVVRIFEQGSCRFHPGEFPKGGLVGALGYVVIVEPEVGR